MCSAKDRRGFTLIELLVVVAIIAILAGLLMPALELARRKARQASCTSQLKQFDTALTIYRNNFVGQAQMDGWPAWLSNLYGSGDLDTKDVFICPADDTRGQEGSRPAWSTWASMGGAVEYTDQFRETDDLPSNKTGSDWSYEVEDYGTDMTYNITHPAYQININDRYVEPYKIRTDEIEACSYMYELCAAQCYWYAASYDVSTVDSGTHGGNGDGYASWAEVKLIFDAKGIGKPDTEEGYYSCVPVVRCFHHTSPDWKTHGADNKQTVLNLDLQHRVFACDGRQNAWQDFCTGED
jgi:prepilin-type N-terminal cleavage/methylation domain-containing protein